MSMPSSNWAAQAFQKTFTNVFHTRGVSTRRRRSRRPAQQISLESLEPRQMLSVNPASSGSSASSANDNSNIAAFVSENSIRIPSTVPGKPTSVVAVRGNASLAVTWTAPASNGGSAITDYVVKYSSNNGMPMEDLTWTHFSHPVSKATACTVTGLTNGTAYVIQVIAKNAVGSSPASVKSAAVIPGLLSISMVTVGNPGNAADILANGPWGAVSYSYMIGKYDVPGSQYTVFLNAVGSTDTYALYNPNMTDTQSAQTSRSGTAGTYTYAVINSTGNRPISFVS